MSEQVDAHASGVALQDRAAMSAKEFWLSGKSKDFQAETSAVSVLKALVTLFPEQHPHTSKWLSALGELSAEGATDSQVGLLQQTDTPSIRKSLNKGQSSESNDESTGKLQAPTKPKPKAQPQSPPFRARLLDRNLNEWRDQAAGE